VKDDTKFSIAEQLEIATHMSIIRGLRLLGERGIPYLKTFYDMTNYFTFSTQQLRDYIATSGRAPELLQLSYDQRSTPSAYMMEVPDGFEVGWYEGGVDGQDKRFHKDMEEAATDFVLAWWKMPRP